MTTGYNRVRAGMIFDASGPPRRAGEGWLRDVAARRGVSKLVGWRSELVKTVAISFAATGSLSRVPPWVCALMRAQVEACRQVHAALAGDPRLAVYSGVSLAETVGQAARTVSCRARELLDQSREG